jgi:predicted O-methyltransferase YrrM
VQYPNWFRDGGAEANFKKILVGSIGKPISCLQIGSYTGDASLWISEQILKANEDARLIDVDTWEGSDEPAHEKMDWESVESVYDQKLDSYLVSGQISKKKMTSDEFFASNSEKFDFIYVDGDHKASSVLKDGLNAVHCIEDGGIIAFDDYVWRSGKGVAHDPYPAIDAIINCYSDTFTVIEMGLQVWLKKN